MLLVLIGHLYIFERWWLGIDIRVDTRRHMSRRDWIMCSNPISHYMLNRQSTYLVRPNDIMAHCEWILLSRTNSILTPRLSRIGYGLFTYICIHAKNFTSQIRVGHAIE